MLATPPAAAAVYFDGTSSRRRAVTLHFADRLEIRDGDAMLAAWAYADIRRADSPSGMLRAELPDGGGAGAARGPRCRARGRAGFALRRHRRKYARPPRRRDHRRLVARGRGFDRRRGAVRRAARGRSPDAAGAAVLRTPARRRRRRPGQDDVRRQGLRRCGRAGGLRQARHGDRAKPPASIRRCSPACCRRRFPMPSRCRAARSICSTACWRRPTMPTRSPACWRTNSAISSIATTCAG